jgi:hypothetical protein
MGLLELIRNIVTNYKKVDTTKLPSQGYFYPKDFQIRLKKASDEDIIDYEVNYNRENILEVIESVKNIVEKNTVFNSKYCFEDLKSVDILYLFLEIVKYTKSKKIFIEFYNETQAKKDRIEFSSENYNYFDLSKFDTLYSSDTLDFLVNSYRFSMPSIGVENSLTQYLLQLVDEPDTDKYNDYSYDFLFFLGFKRILSTEEIENLITIFNFEMEDEEREKLKSTIEEFMEIILYTLKSGNNIIEVKSKLDLESIWKVDED